MSTSLAIEEMLKEIREASQGRKMPEKARKSTSVESGYPGSTENSKSTQSPTESAASGDSGTAYVPTAKVLALAADRLPAPAPCPTCGCPLFWLDAYNRVRCAECSPPHSVNVQRGDLHVLAIGDAFEWSHRLPDLTPRLEPNDTPRQRTASQIVASTLDSLRPTTEQIDAGECCDESPACEVCKKKFLQQNIFGEGFCDGCQPPRKRRDGGSTASRAIIDSIVLRTLVEQSPEAAAFRERAIRKRKSLEPVE